MGAHSVGGAFRCREFRAVWLAELLSIAGDQLARVALAVLVFDRTDSPAWAATTYALTFLPALVGGMLLSGLADRCRRREVMVVCDGSRAVLVAAMAVPGLPIGLLCALLVVVVLLGAPYAAAQGALLPAVLGRHYERGLAVRQVTGQTAQVAGFAVGGLLVAGIGSGPALLLDALTFAVSGLLIRIGLADRPSPATGQDRTRDGADRPGVFRIVLADPRRRVLLLLAWLVGCYVVPEALAAPYAAQVRADSAAVGLLMAADPLGSVLGAWLFFRFVPPAVRDRLIGVLAVLAGLPLVLTALRPDVVAALLLWALSGAASTAYLLQAQASFVRATPDGDRGRAIGFAGSGLVAGQGVAVLIGGVVAEATSASTAIGVLGAAGVLLAALGAVAWYRAGPEDRAISRERVLVGG
jgi:MFS family permease